MLDKGDMYPYQVNVKNLIVENTHFGLFMQMGLGKTVSTLSAVEELINELLDIETVLVVAPKRVVEDVWPPELEKWSHLSGLSHELIAGTPAKRRAALKRKADIYLISRDLLAWLIAEFGGLKLPFDMLVVDESSSFKNPTSLRFKALKPVLPCFSRVVILTGTPRPKGLQDLWSQIYLLDRGARLGKTITQFREAFLYAAKSQGYIVHQYGSTKASEDRVTELISDIVVSMKQEDYLDLPEFTERDRIIKLDDATAARYKEFEREKVLELMDSGDTITALNAGALVNKLLQYANGAVYNENKEAIEVHSLKLDALEDMAADAQGEPILVAYSYQSDRDRILKRLKKYGAEVFTGGDQVKRWNAREIPLLLMHPASGGHGLNLQHGGNQIVWFGNSWDLELVDQLNHRLKRPGQDKSVIITRLVCEGTQDERVIRSQAEKRTGQDALMDSVNYLLSRYRSQ